MTLLIQNKLAGHVIDIQGNSTADGALLDAYHAKTAPGDNPANQQWEFNLDPAGSGYYLISNPPTGHVIDIQGNSTADGASLDAYHAKTAPGQNHDNQLWQLIPDPGGSGYFFLQNKLTGHVIDVSHNSTTDGAALDAFPLKLFGNDNQLWAPLQGNFPPAVNMATPPSNLGGFNQYVLSGGATSVPLKNITVTIDVIEDIVTSSLGVQINGFANQGDKAVDWQQYGIQMEPGSNQLVAFANNWPDPITTTDWLFILQSPPIVTLPNAGTIPAGYRIVIQLTNQEGGQYDGTITGVIATVYDNTGKQLGTQQQIVLLGQGLQSGGTVSQQDLAPLVAFQVVLVGWADHAHAQLSSGMGTITCQSTTPMTPSVPWPSYSDGANGTAESSNCLYGLVPAQSSLSVVQSFGVPSPMVTDIQGVSEFVVTGSGFLSNAQLTLSYVLTGGGSGASESNSVACVAASNGSFSCTIEPPNYPGPEFASGTVVSFSVMVKDQHGDYAEADCQVDAQGRIANFRRVASGVGSST
jgi:ricin-type beta-trefoil lectin protein